MTGLLDKASAPLSSGLALSRVNSPREAVSSMFFPSQSVIWYLPLRDGPGGGASETNRAQSLFQKISEPRDTQI